MTSYVLSPEMKKLIYRAKQNGGAVTCDPRAFYPVGHKCAGTTQPVTGKISPPWIKGGILKGPIDSGGRPIPKDVTIVKSVPLQNGGAVTEFDTGGGETVTAVTDANGGVKKVEVKNKYLIPAAIAAAFFLLG